MNGTNKRKTTVQTPLLAPSRTCSQLPFTAELPALPEQMGSPPIEYAPIVAALLRWFAANMRPLPWRKTYDPYAVWVSEIMLQQTQMERGALYFARWMRHFPTLRSLAESDEERVLKAWEGLGYYNRARNLHKAAQKIMYAHQGCIPADLETLRALPGIGEYTAGAILSIAFNQPVPAVDSNVERVFARLFDIDMPVKSIAAADYIRRMAGMLIPSGKARAFNQALMELGALVCRTRPLCTKCPLGCWCRAKRLGITAERPVPNRRVASTSLEIVSGVLVHEGCVFIQKRRDFGLWAGFWEFPGGHLEAEESPEQGIIREFWEETELPVTVCCSLGLVRHAYTRYRITMHCFLLTPRKEKHGKALPLKPALHAATQYRWVRPDTLDAYPLPAGHRKIVDTWLPELQKAATGE